MSETPLITTLTFLAYVFGVFLLAGFAHRFLENREFVGEYFLGSRGLRSWSLAFAFAATATSAGSFIGFPALIYSYGWILALWIGSYMIYPLSAMGVLGKRLNQVARKSGAITIPDVLRDRFNSPSLGLFLTCTIILFTTCNLVAQFKAGALIVEETLNLPEGFGYQAGLILFALVVVLYTAYGGFRAVVWTDVMQGVVMGAGVIVLLPIVLIEVGGVEAATEKLLHQSPTVITSIPGNNNDLAFVLADLPSEIQVAVEYVSSSVEDLDRSLDIALISRSSVRIVRVGLQEMDGRVVTRAVDVKRAIESDWRLKGWIRSVELAYDNDGTGPVAVMPATYAVRGEDLLFGPGRKNNGLPFHPLGLAISFFVMWAITAMGQPGMMVRLMAFQDSRTLKRAIIIVSFYFLLIYLPLVLIFTSARVLIPYLSPENADKAMVLVASRIVGSKGTGYAILAAVFLAAPFAAVMSTVDSFLLMISSAIVRDIYQRSINPQVSQKSARYMSYTTTMVIGIFVTIMASRQIDFLQYIVVFTSSGFAATFLAPTLLGIYWKGMTREGALWSACGGLLLVLGFFSPTLWGAEKINLLSLHPVVWGLLGSFLLGLLVSKLTGPPPEYLVRKYFYVEEPDPAHSKR